MKRAVCVLVAVCLLVLGFVGTQGCGEGGGIGDSSWVSFDDGDIGITEIKREEDTVVVRLVIRKTSDERESTDGVGSVEQLKLVDDRRPLR